MEFYERQYREKLRDLEQERAARTLVEDRLTSAEASLTEAL